MNNTGIVVKLSNVRTHPNADKLQLATVLGTTIVLGLDAKEGDIGCYFDSNLAMSPHFLRANNLYRDKTLNADPEHVGYFDENGRVKCIKLRGELSDGFFCEKDSIERAIGITVNYLPEPGFEFTEMSGVPICCKYVPKLQKIPGLPHDKNKKICMSSPMFVEHFETDQYMRNKHKLWPGMIYLEEKLHGTSHRTGNVLVENELDKKAKFFAKVLGWFKLKLNTHEWKYMNGTRRVVLDSNKDQNHFHDNTMRDEVLDHLKGQMLKGEEAFMELVGYEKTGAQIQKGFPYGCHEKQYKVLLYRVTMNTVEAKVFDLHREAVYRRADELGLLRPTLFEKYYYDGTEESLAILTDKIVEYAQGQSTWDDNTLREGVVVWFVNEKGYWVALKYKSDAFKLSESKGRDNGVVDQEDLN